MEPNRGILGRESELSSAENTGALNGKRRRVTCEPEEELLGSFFHPWEVFLIPTLDVKGCRITRCLLSQYIMRIIS